MKRRLLLLGMTAGMSVALGVLNVNQKAARVLNQNYLLNQNNNQPQPQFVNYLAAKITTTVPVQEILSKLKGKTAVPIFIPSQISASEKIYFSSEARKDGYTISIGYTPNCQAGACSFGEIRAEKGGEFSQKIEGVTKTLKTVQLVGGVKGVFHNGCGAYCTASVEWKQQGILYGVAIKNGREAETIAVANSALQAGPR
ncbi:MAG: hypothetical protein ACM37W_14210 [Actinomycetota bacterium]